MWLRRLLLATALGLTLGGAATGDEPSDDVPVQFGGPFSLTDHDGAPRTDADFRGRYLLVYFGYTACPDLCPLGLTTLSAALDLLGGAADPIQPLFISVDPARDTVARMRVFVGRFHPRLIGLTGSEAEVGAAARAYKVFRRKVIPPDEDPADYLVNHTPITYLMGPDGRFLTLFPHDTEPEVMARAIRSYLAE